MALVALLLATPASGAPDDEARRAELEQLRARIAQLQQELDQVHGERDSVSRELRDTERRVGELLRGIRDLDRRLADTRSRLRDLNRLETRQRQSLGADIRRLEQQARASYLLGRQEYLKLLLSERDPARLNRTLTYYRYLNEARARQIRGARTALTDLRVTAQQAARRGRELEDLRAEQLARQQALDDARAARSAVLAQLNTQAASKTREIDRLRQNEQRLDRLLRGLRSLAPAPVTVVPGGHFADQRGRLPLPVQGRITARYGGLRGSGELRWSGVFLATPPGRDVVAVFRGRVAYADWLRGFGLLLIVDHGDGYLTLYGHNQSLYKQAGEWVEAGQVVGTTGNTGGPPEPGLYFEVRQNGEPRDPLLWCQAR